METIRKVISLEQARSRAEGELYGTLTATSFYFKVLFTQNMDDMGMFTDFPFIAGTDLDRTLTMEEKLLRLSGTEASDWYASGQRVSGMTDTKLDGLRTYSQGTPYIVGFDIESETYNNYEGDSIQGVSRVTSLSGDAITYTYDADLDVTIGTSLQTSGILYSENTTNESTSGTTMNYIGEGWNETNASLAAIVKEEYLMGIINPPEVKNDVFIDRGNVTVMENHLRLSEIESLEHLVRYGNGFYNIVKQ